MDTSQEAETRMQEIRRSRLWEELFGEDGEADFNVGPIEQNSEASECSPVVLSKRILTKPSHTRMIPESELRQRYPALMDPRILLQLITRFTAHSVFIWANHGRPKPILQRARLQTLQTRSLKLMGERIPGGEDVLQQSLDIFRSHHRLDIGKHSYRRRTGTHQDIDAWYQRRSTTITSDFSRLPLSYSYHTGSRETLTLLLGSSGLQPLSLVLSDLLHDPSFTYQSLQDIPDQVLLDICTTHSYPHVLDMLKVNNPCIKTTQEDIEHRVDSLIQAPVPWKPAETAEKTEPSKNCPRPCVTCVDQGITDCRILLQDTDSNFQCTVPRFPGQRCALCQSLKQPCEDISTNRASSARKDFDTESRKAIYRKRQKFGGHLIERIEEKKIDQIPTKRRARELRAQIYSLLPQRGRGKNEPLIQGAKICLPSAKDNDSKLLALFESMSRLGDQVQSELDQAAALQAQALGMKVVADNNAGQIHEDEEMEDEEIDGEAIERLLMTSDEEMEDEEIDGEAIERLLTTNDEEMEDEEIDDEEIDDEEMGDDEIDDEAMDDETVERLVSTCFERL